MSDQYSLNHIDSLIFQLALQTRELSQKKKETNQQIQVCKADIAEKKAYIGTIHQTIKKLEEEISMNQSTVIRNKEEAKSLKATNGLMLRFEHTLKSELESRKVRYNNDTEVYDERIASCIKTLELHQEHYFQNPLAQKLLILQAEKEKIECRIKACNDQITMKQKELDHLTTPAVSSVSTEKLPDSVIDQHATTEQEESSDIQTEDRNSSNDISSHVSQTKNGHQTTVKTIADDIHEESVVHGSSTCSPVGATEDLWSYQHLDEESQMNTDEDGYQEAVQEEQEQQFSASGVEDDQEDEMLQNVAVYEEQAPNEKDNSGVTVLPQMSFQETCHQPLPENVTSVPSTPTFPIKFNPGNSPQQSTPDTKSPAFLFSVSSSTSTPGFSGFGFDVGSLQDEDSAFGSFFTEKKTAESKSPVCPEFLFGQPEQSETFQFAFSSKSPVSADKESTGDDFPFSFNF